MAPWTEADVPDQSGRTVVITGANSGLGLRTATVLARAGARVLLACRSAERGRAALDEVGSADAELVTLDLADLSSVRAAAADIRERTGDALDVLVNNAGVMATPQRRTADGFELQFGTNHLGHAALTWLLMPALRASGARNAGRGAGGTDTGSGARVVTMSSFVAQIGTVDVRDPNFTRRRYTPTLAYGQAKMANLLFALELDRRLRAAGDPVLSAAAHPGYAATELQANMARSRGSTLLQRGVDVANGLFAQPARMGALPELYAATAPDVQGGDYVGPGGLLETRGFPRKVPVRRAKGRDQVRERLWDLTAELTGVTPDPA